VGLGLSLADLPEAAASAQSVLPILARAAVLEDEAGAAAALLAKLSDPAWPGDLLNLPMDWSIMSTEMRRGLVAATFRPDAQLGVGYELYRLSEFLGSALELAFAARLLASPALAARIAQLAAQAETDDKADIDFQLLPLAAVTPPATAGAFNSALAPIPTVRRPKTSAWLAFLGELAALAPAS